MLGLEHAWCEICREGFLRVGGETMLDGETGLEEIGILCGNLMDNQIDNNFGISTSEQSDGNVWEAYKRGRSLQRTDTVS